MDMHFDTDSKDAFVDVDKKTKKENNSLRTTCRQRKEKSQRNEHGRFCFSDRLW